MKLSVHDTVLSYEANGPGKRFVLWLQGCTLGCPGCFNPDTHASHGGKPVETGDLVKQIIELEGSIDGISITGGEPLQQPEPLLEFLKDIRRSTNLSIILFTGYTWSEAAVIPFASEVLASSDVVLAGRYNNLKHLAKDLRGSSNKSIHFITNRFHAEQFTRVPDAEVIILDNGDISVTGIFPPSFLQFGNRENSSNDL